MIRLPDVCPNADQTGGYIWLVGFLSEMYLCSPVSQDQHKALSVWSIKYRHLQKLCEMCSVSVEC